MHAPADRNPARRPQVSPWPSIVFFLVVAVIGASAITGYRDLRALESNYAWVTHTHDALREIDAALMSISEQEIAVRGYLITGDEAILAPFEVAVGSCAAHLRKLAELTRDNVVQLERVKQFDRLVAHQADASRDLIRTRRNQGFNAAEMGLLANRWPQFMDQIQVVAAEIRTTEEQLLTRRAAISRATYDTTLRAGALMAMLALLFLTAAYVLFWRALVRQRQSVEEIETRHLELEGAVKRRTAELREFSFELERSNRELEQFAFVASHDLQEPLRKIQTFSDRLLVKHGEAMDPAARDYLDRIVSSAGRMRRLIDDLLAYSRVHTRGEPFASVDLNAVVRGVLGDLEQQIERTQGRVELAPLPTIEADAVQMRQLFQNLIGNALKFHAPDRPPCVRIEAETADPEAPRLPPPDDAIACRITVSDNGVGFEPEYADKIFEVFQRLHGHSAFEGSGMGLAISRRIVERHGGRISAQGRPGQGATFVVVLPMFRTPTED